MRLRSRSSERRWLDEDEVKFEESDMIPKSGKSPADTRKSVGIHEFAALARSSLNGISQAVKDHVTKPTSLAQGRVAHLIEWKGWPKPVDPPQAAHFSSYCHLSEVEKEARFAAGVAEQFAIAEAKLRAWASVDEDDADEEEEEDSNDEDPKADSPTDFPPHSTADSTTSDPTCAAPVRSEGISEGCGGGGEVCVHHKPEWRPGRFDSCYSTSHSESPGEEEEEDEVFHEARAWSSGLFPSDRASSGVASLDEDDQDNQDQGGEKMEEKEYLM